MPMARLTAPHFKPSQPLSSSPVGRITDSRHAQAIRLHELQTRRQVRAAAVPAQVDRAIPCAGRALRFAGRRWRTDQGQASCACRTVCTTLYDQGHPPVGRDGCAARHAIRHHHPQTLWWAFKMHGDTSFERLAGISNGHPKNHRISLHSIQARLIWFIFRLVAGHSGLPRFSGPTNRC